MEGKIIDLNGYKREKGIAPPHSPYYALKATNDELQTAFERAAESLQDPFDYRGVLPYAVLVGYENKKTGAVKLLKEQIVFPTEAVYQSTCPGIKGYYSLTLKWKAE